MFAGIVVAEQVITGFCNGAQDQARSPSRRWPHATASESLRLTKLINREEFLSNFLKLGHGFASDLSTQLLAGTPL